MKCYSCTNDATQECRRCGRLYCDEHGDELCAECLKPAGALPSFLLYRGSLLALLLGTAVALWLLLKPPEEASQSQINIVRADGNDRRRANARGRHAGNDAHRRCARDRHSRRRHVHGAGRRYSARHRRAVPAGGRIDNRLSRTVSPRRTASTRITLSSIPGRSLTIPEVIGNLLEEGISAARRHLIRDAVIYTPLFVFFLVVWAIALTGVIVARRRRRHLPAGAAYDYGLSCRLPEHPVAARPPFDAGDDRRAGHPQVAARRVPSVPRTTIST